MAFSCWSFQLNVKMFRMVCFFPFSQFCRICCTCVSISIILIALQIHIFQATGTMGRLVSGFYECEFYRMFATKLKSPIANCSKFSRFSIKITSHAHFETYSAFFSIYVQLALPLNRLGNNDVGDPTALRAYIYFQINLVFNPNAKWLPSMDECILQNCGSMYRLRREALVCGPLRQSAEKTQKNVVAAGQPPTK